MAEGRIPTAAKVYASWRQAGKRPRDTKTIERANLLAAHLDLLAGRLRPARMRLRSLEKSLPPDLYAPLKSRLMASEGDVVGGIKLLSAVLAELPPSGDPAIRSALHRQRGQLAIENGDMLAALADFDDAERSAELAGEEELLYGIRLDRAEALLAAGEHDECRVALPSEKNTPRELLARRLGLQSRLDNLPVDGKTDNLAGTEAMLAYARSKTLDGDVSEASERLASLETAGWFSTVEALRAKSLLIEALICWKTSENRLALKRLSMLRRVCTPGTSNKYAAASDWLRMRIAVDEGDSRRALSAGRRVLASLESMRHGVHSLDYLRRISGGHAEFYGEIIGLELRFGDARRAYNALQQFSARALLRRMTGKGWFSPHAGSGAPPGTSSRRGLDLALRKLDAVGRDVLRWPQLTEVLQKLNSED